MSNYKEFNFIKHKLAPIWIRFLLLFVKSRYAKDRNGEMECIVKYKMLKGVVYVIDSYTL